MSRTGQKRLKTTEIPNSSRKRRKLVATSKSTNIKPSSSTCVATVSANELAWREVTPPERLDDAEGFLGLEEIDGVEVVRDTNGNQPHFRVHSSIFLAFMISNGFFYQSISQYPSSRTNTLPSKINLSTELGASSENEDEWSGLTDDDLLDAHSREEKTQQRYEEKVSSKTSGKRKLEESELVSEVPYSILDNASEDNGVDTSEWSALPLSHKTLAAIARLGFERPSPIQAAVIPQVLAGHDVIGKAVTGSGKTLAFAIPILEKWRASKTSGHIPKTQRKVLPTSLVLTPTRELAHQLSRHFEDLVENPVEQPRIVSVTGGLSIHKQQRQLVDADIIIGTPGRLWEVMNGSQDLIDDLKRIKFLVIDEADRLLSEGHFKEVEDILDVLDRQVVDDGEVSLPNDADSTRPYRQTLIFSATFHKGLQRKLASKSRTAGGDLLTDKQSVDYLLQKISFREARPKFIDVNPTSQMAQKLKESVVECSAMEKDIYLYSLLIQRPLAKILVFTNSISSVRRLTPLLQNLNFPASSLHSSMPQKARLRSVERFSALKTGGTILIATDVAARGLDIQNIDLIMHYHVPRTADSYVHRSGRTARASKRGDSILLCSPDEVAGVTKLVAQIHSPGAAGNHHLEPIHVDRQLVARLQPRLTLSQKITNATLAKEKVGPQDEWLRTAAEELGVLDFDSDEFAKEGAKNSRGRGATKRQQQKTTGAMSKAEVAGWRAQLKELLGRQVNLGVNERFLAGGGVDVDSLLDVREKSQFLSGRTMAD